MLIRNKKLYFTVNEISKIWIEFTKRDIWPSEKIMKKVEEQYFLMRNYGIEKPNIKMVIYELLDIYEKTTKKEKEKLNTYISLNEKY